MKALLIVGCICIIVASYSLYYLYNRKSASLSDKSSKEKKRYNIALLSPCGRYNDDDCPYIFDKKVTDLWFEIIKEYETEKDVEFVDRSFCRPTVNYGDLYEPSKYLSIIGHDLDIPRDSKVI